MRKALSQYLHANHQPIYESIYAEARRQTEERLKAYYARQAQEKAQVAEQTHSL